MVSPRDRFLTCSSCGVRFVWTAGSRAATTEAPTRCPACRLLVPGPGWHRGLIKFYDPRKGWGFITPSEGPELFFHRSSLQAQWLPQDGDLVEYAVQQTDRGLQAVDIDLLERANQ